MTKKILCAIMLVLSFVCVLASCGDDSSSTPSTPENPAHTHSFGEWEITKAATCTAEGIKERYCSCGDKQSAAISMIEHSYGEWETTKAATCTAEGIKERYCSCGDKQTQAIPMTEHAYGEWETTKAATCTAEGIKERYCSCGDKQTQAIPMTEHAYGEWETVKEATLNDSGIKERVCVCGKKETETIPQLTTATLSAEELTEIFNAVKENYSAQSQITTESDWIYSKEKSVYVNENDFKALYIYEDTSDKIEKWYCKIENEYYVMTKIIAGGNYYQENDAYYEVITEESFNQALNDFKNSSTGLSWVERVLNEFDNAKLNITATLVDSGISYVIDCSEAGAPVTITLEICDGYITKASMTQDDEGERTSVIEYKYEGSITIPDIADFR